MYAFLLGLLEKVDCECRNIYIRTKNVFDIHCGPNISKCFVFHMKYTAFTSKWFYTLEAEIKSKTNRQTIKPIEAQCIFLNHFNLSTNECTYNFT